MIEIINGNMHALSTSVVPPMLIPAIANPFPPTDGSRVFLIPNIPSTIAAIPGNTGINNPQIAIAKLAIASPLLLCGPPYIGVAYATGGIAPAANPGTTNAF
jgi:hypothetical protein